MSTFNNKSFIALLALISGTVAAETDDQQQVLQYNQSEKPKRVQTFGDLLDPDLPGVLTPKGSFVLDTSFSFTRRTLPIQCICSRLHCSTFAPRRPYPSQ